MMSTDENDEIFEHIRKLIADNDVVLFMKGSPQFPQCGFSATVSRILDHMGVTFESVDILKNNSLREGIKVFSDWPTIPQLYIKGEFVGGCDILRDMFEAGELKTLFSDKGIACQA